MKIGIIIHSQTGNTNSVAVKLKDKLMAAGHEVDLERLKVVGAARLGTKAKDIRFEALPQTDKYDAIIFGSPVEAFSLSSVTKSYLQQVAALDGKNIAFLVTQFFPYPWMGGNRAVKQMRELCEAKGGKVLGSAIVNWSRRDRNARIERCVDQLSTLLDPSKR